MYAVKNFQSKKALKEAVAAGEQVRVYQHNDIFGAGEALLDASWESPQETTLEGPHYPQPHRWYARVRVENGVVTKVLG